MEAISFWQWVKASDVRGNAVSTIGIKDAALTGNCNRDCSNAANDNADVAMPVYCFVLVVVVYLKVLITLWRSNSRHLRGRTSTFGIMDKSK